MDGPTFAIQPEVKQGDPLSPSFFSYLLEEVFQKTKWENTTLKKNRLSKFDKFEIC